MINLLFCKPRRIAALLHEVEVEVATMPYSRSPQRFRLYCWVLSTWEEGKPGFGF